MWILLVCNCYTFAVELFQQGYCPVTPQDGVCALIEAFFCWSSDPTSCGRGRGVRLRVVPLRRPEVRPYRLFVGSRYDFYLIPLKIWSSSTRVLQRILTGSPVSVGSKFLLRYSRHFCVTGIHRYGHCVILRYSTPVMSFGHSGRWSCLWLHCRRVVSF